MAVFMPLRFVFVAVFCLTEFVWIRWAMHDAVCIALYLLCSRGAYII